MGRCKIIFCGPWMDFAAAQKTAWVVKNNSCGPLGNRTTLFIIELVFLRYPRFSGHRHTGPGPSLRISKRLFGTFAQRPFVGFE